MVLWYRCQDYVTILVRFVTVVKVQSIWLRYVALMRIERDAAVVPQHGDAIWARDGRVPDRRRLWPEECLVTPGPSALGAAARSCGAERWLGLAPHRDPLPLVDMDFAHAHPNAALAIQSRGNTT
jgi:hypothetical protein